MTGIVLPGTTLLMFTVFGRNGDVMTGENGVTDPSTGKIDDIDSTVESDKVIGFIIREDGNIGINPVEVESDEVIGFIIGEDENTFGKGIIVVTGGVGNKKGNIREDKNELCVGVCPIGDGDVVFEHDAKGLLRH